MLVSREATPLYLVYAASELPGVVYRAVSACPPTVDDFRSYVELGRRYPVRSHFRATGISVSRDLPTLRTHIRDYGLAPAVATLDLRNAEAVWASSGGRHHLTVWAPSAVLLSLVVQCDDHD